MTPDGRLPPGACDCHTHVVGPSDRYPMVPSRHYTPGPASVSDLQAHLARLGLGRVVVIQPSVYGTDNRCLVDSLRQLGGAGRGVAVVDDGATDAELAVLHDAGVRGLRLNLESSGDQDAAQAATNVIRWADRLAARGWHLQVFATLATLVALLERVPDLAVPLVFDHFAMVGSSMETSDASVRPLLRAIHARRVHVKLSAPYRIAPGLAAASTASRWAAIFREAAPDQLLWASDWPHTDRQPGRAPHEVSAYRDIPSDTLLRALDDWLPDDAIRQQVLVDNPARLYDF